MDALYCYFSSLPPSPSPLRVASLSGRAKGRVCKGRGWTTYMYVCMYVCMYIYIYMYTHTYIYVYTHVIVYVHTHTHEYSIAVYICVYIERPAAVFIRKTTAMATHPEHIFVEHLYHCQNQKPYETTVCLYETYETYYTTAILYTLCETLPQPDSRLGPSCRWRRTIIVIIIINRNNNNIVIISINNNNTYNNNNKTNNNINTHNLANNNNNNNNNNIMIE